MIDERNRSDKVVVILGEIDVNAIPLGNVGDKINPLKAYVGRMYSKGPCSMRI